MPFLPYNTIDLLKAAKDKLISGKSDIRPTQAIPPVPTIFSGGTDDDNSNDAAPVKSVSTIFSDGTNDNNSLPSQPLPSPVPVPSPQAQPAAPKAPQASQVPQAPQPSTTATITAPTSMPAAQPAIGANGVPVDQRADPTKSQTFGDLGTTQKYIQDMYTNLRDTGLEAENKINERAKELAKKAEEISDKKFEGVGEAYDQLIAENEAAREKVLKVTEDKKKLLDALAGRDKSAQASQLLNTLRSRGIDISNPLALVSVSAQIDKDYLNAVDKIEADYKTDVSNTITTFLSSRKSLIEEKTRQEGLHADEIKTIQDLLAQADTAALRNKFTLQSAAEKAQIGFAEAERDFLFNQTQSIRSGFSSMSPDDKIASVVNLIKSNDPERVLTGEEMAKLAVIVRSSSDLTEAVQKFQNQLPIDSSLRSEGAQNTFETIIEASKKRSSLSNQKSRNSERRSGDKSKGAFNITFTRNGKSTTIKAKDSAQVKRVTDGLRRAGVKFKVTEGVQKTKKSTKSRSTSKRKTSSKRTTRRKTSKKTGGYSITFRKNGKTTTIKAKDSTQLKKVTAGLKKSKVKYTVSRS